MIYKLTVSGKNISEEALRSEDLNELIEFGREMVEANDYLDRWYVTDDKEKAIADSYDK